MVPAGRGDAGRTPRPTRGCSRPPRPPGSGEFAVAEPLAGEALRPVPRARRPRRQDARAQPARRHPFERGRLGEAEQSLAEALSLATQLGDSLTAARACNNLASALHLRGRPDEAVGLYRGALLAYQRLGDRRGTAEAYHNLGLIYRQLGEWRSAEDATGEALRHAEFVGERGLLALATTGRAELMAERAQLAAGEAGARACRAAGRRRPATRSAAPKSSGCARWWRTRMAIWKPRSKRRRPPSRPPGPTTAPLLAAECAALVALTLKRLGRHADADGAASRRRRGSVGWERSRS